MTTTSVWCSIVQFPACLLVSEDFIYDYIFFMAGEGKGADRHGNDRTVITTAGQTNEWEKRLLTYL